MIAAIDWQAVVALVWPPTVIFGYGIGWLLGYKTAYKQASKALDELIDERKEDA